MGGLRVEFFSISSLWRVEGRCGPVVSFVADGSNGQGWECSVALRCGASASATRWSVGGCRREVADEEVPRLAVWRDVAWRGEATLASLAVFP